MKQLADVIEARIPLSLAWAYCDEIGHASVAILAMLWLAQLHGGNGLRTVIADYARKDSTRFWLNTALVVSMILIMTVGTYVIFTFDPNIS